MRQNLNKLWNEMYSDGSMCPSVDPAAIKRRVNAALDVSAPERKSFMRKRVYMIAVAAALIAALAGTALAVYYRKTALSYFDGDTSQIEPAVQQVDQTSEQGSYRLHVDSVLSDAHNTILGLTLEAVDEDSQGALWAEDFVLLHVVMFEAEQANSLTYLPTFRETSSESGSSQRCFSIRLTGIGAPNTLHIYLAGEPKESGITLALVEQLKSLTATAEEPTGEEEYYIRSCLLNEIGIILTVDFREQVRGDKIVELYFRTADGSIKTLSQIAGSRMYPYAESIPGTDDLEFSYKYSFVTPIDLLSVSGVIMNGKEYSFLEPNKVEPVEVPQTLRPFLTPFAEKEDRFWANLSDVCRHLGAEMEIGDEICVVRYLDRVVTISLKDDNVYFDGKDIFVSSNEIWDAFALNISMYYPQMGGPVQAPKDWLIMP